MELILIVGILFGLASGIINNLGIVFQKLAINRLPEGKKVTKGLLKNKMWLFGFIMNGYMPLPFSLLALGLGVGPALLPGLEAFGLIFLAIGALRILRESIKASEMLGIILMVTAILCLLSSGMAIDVGEYGYTLGTDFFTRVIIMTVVAALFSLTFFTLRRVTTRPKSVMYALDSGFMWIINNFWFAVVIGIATHFFSGGFLMEEVYVLPFAVPLLISTEILGVHRLQKSFEYGQASNMRPIQQAPIQIAPVFYFFAVYLLPPPYPYSLHLALVGIAFILISMTLLSVRQAQLSKIK